MNNIKLTIEYDGSNYCGWQRQINGISVQEIIEDSIFKLINEKVTINGSGRTDAKVHAYGQVANFKTDSTIPPEIFYKALNRMLPNDIKCINSQLVDDTFHARYNATGKHYRYLILNREIRPTIQKGYVEHIVKPLDINLMKKALKYFEGQHDFVGFMSSKSNIKNTIRTINSTNIDIKGDLIIIDISGNGFLYNMVRIIVGVLVDVGRGRIKIDEIKDIIESKDRNRVGKTLSASGLYLMEVFYQNKE